MTRAEVIGLLNSCEEKFPFAEKAWIGDVNIWPLVKITMGSLLVSADTELRSNTHPARKANATKGAFEFRAAKKKISKTVEVLFISETDCWSKVNEKWSERFADPFIDLFEELGVRSCIALRTPKPIGDKSKDHPEVDLQNALYFKSLIWWKTKKPPVLPQVILDGLKWVESKTRPLDRNYLHRMVFLMLFHDKFFSDLLSNSNIKVIFISCYYSAYNMGIIKAAARLGISTVDLQHGVQGKNHFAYSHWLLPKNGFDTLPKWFWCWQQNDADHITSWSKGTAHKVILGGDLWIRSWFQGGLVHKMREQLPYVPVGDRVVLFSLQPAKDELPTELINSIRSSKNIQWWLREHPSHRKDLIEFQGTLDRLGIGNKVQIGDVSDLPLPLVLSQVDIHITNWSSVVLDAEKVGIPSIIIHPIGKDVFSNLIEQGRVKYYAGRNKLLELIQKTKTVKVALRSDADTKNNLRMIISDANER